MHLNKLFNAPWLPIIIFWNTAFFCEAFNRFTDSCRLFDPQATAYGAWVIHNRLWFIGYTMFTILRQRIDHIIGFQTNPILFQVHCSYSLIACNFMERYLQCAAWTVQPGPSKLNRVLESVRLQSTLCKHSSYPFDLAQSYFK